MPTRHHLKPTQPRSSSPVPSSPEKTGSPKGRTSKLESLLNDSPEQYQTMLGYLRAGSYLHVAAAAVGIAPETLSRWLSKGKEARSGIYRQFRQECLQAVAEASVVAEVALHQSKPETWLRCGPRRLLGSEWQETTAPATTINIATRQAMVLTEEQKSLIQKEWHDAGVVMPGVAIDTDEQGQLNSDSEEGI